MDHEVLSWSLANGCIVLTQDLDFGALLALTRSSGPSVVLIRTQDALPGQLGSLLCRVLHEYESQLLAGALVVVDEARARIRLLPIR